jgi:general secretion pathway protein A
VAGARDLGLFSREAVARIADYSGGTPRLVNILCDHCLVFAYADQVRRIGPDIVDQAIEYLDDGEPTSRRGRAARRGFRMTAWRWAVLALSAAAAGVAALSAFDGPAAWRMLDVGSDLARSARHLLPL